MRFGATILCILMFASAKAAPVGTSTSALTLSGRSSVDQAVGIYLTDRGQRYFRENFRDLLFRQGFSIDEGGFDKWEYQATEPLSLDRLPLKFEPFKGTLGQVRDLLKKWLVGFSFNDPLFKADLNAIHYELGLNRFGIRVDTEATALRPGNRSIVLVFEIEANKGKFEAESLLAEDLANPFLKTFGANQPWVSLHKESVPLKIEVPILFEIDDTKALRYRVLDLRSNLAAVQFDAGFNRPLLLPQVKLIVNGKVMPLNQAKLEELLLKHKPRLLKALQLYLEEFAQTKGPAYLNDLVQKHTPEGLWEVNQMDPPGAPIPKAGERGVEKFSWSLRPEAIRVTPNYLNVTLSATVDDPTRSRQTPYYGRKGGTPYPALDLIAPTDYDLALTLNVELINRILQLSFERGYFDRIELDGGTTLKLVRLPLFATDPKLPPDRAKLHIRAQQKVTGFNKFAVRSPLEFDVDIEVKMIRTVDGGVAVELVRICEESIAVEDRFIKIGVFRGAVLSGVKKKVAAANAVLASKPKRLVDQLPIPPDLAGVPIRAKAFQSDRNGHLVIYVEYVQD